MLIITMRVIRSQEIPYEAYASQKNTKEPKENTWCYTLFLSFIVVALHLDLEIKSVEMKSSYQSCYMISLLLTRDVREFVQQMWILVNSS